MKAKTATKLPGAAVERAKARSQQRVVSRLVKEWEDIAKRKDDFAKSAKQMQNYANSYRASGIASAFRYCAFRLKHEAGG